MPHIPNPTTDPALARLAVARWHAAFPMDARTTEARRLRTELSVRAELVAALGWPAEDGTAAGRYVLDSREMVACLRADLEHAADTAAR